MGCSRSSIAFDTSGHGAVGEIARLSGFKPIIRDDTSFRWLCPECVAKVAAHVRALQEILKDEGVYWNGLKCLLKEA
jgi:hypothetical protein